MRGGMATKGRLLLPTPPTPLLLLLALLLSLAPPPCGGCSPGRGGIRRRGARKLTPLVYKQHEPNFSERSLAAAGMPEGPVDRVSERFRRLVPNYNPDIVFKDEEGTGADRLMTQRCKEKLNTLSISVMNQWPGLHLRVTEAWDEDAHHSRHSLHYEGRAVDLTTSDRDRRKYGMLARLAVEAGFDWVYYESRSHIHASCKSEASSPDKTGGGCFSANSTVLSSDGRRLRMSEVRPGDRVLAVNPDTGELAFSPVLLFLDRDPEEARRFVTLATEDGRRVTLTPTHLVYAARRAEDDDEEEEVEGREFSALFAGDLSPGDLLLTKSSSGELGASLVSSVTASRRGGVFAPLTEHGNLVVDGVVASCYAVVDSQSVAHAAFWPLRAAARLARVFGLGGASSPEDQAAPLPPSGVHWYASALYSLAENVIPNHLR